MVKYLMVFALVCGLSLVATAEAKEVVVDPVVPPEVVAEVVDEVDVRIGGAIRVRHLNWADMFFGTGTGIVDEAWLETRTRLLMEADLADDVTVVVRLSNNRDWGTGGGDIDVVLDWSYITIANVAGQMMDLTVGRQPIELGDSMQIDANFDAIKLSMPFEPVTVDAFFAKIADARAGLVADDDLIGFHIVYLLPDPAIAINMGYYELIDRDADGSAYDSRIRSMAISAEGKLFGFGDIGLLASGGMIFQTGDVVVGAASKGLDADALYFEVGALTGVGLVSLQWASLSGDDTVTPENEEFQPMFEDVDFGTVIVDEIQDADPLGLAGIDNLNTNLNLWGLGFKTSPMPGVGVSLNYIDLTRDVGGDLGTELNIGVEKALTEDVTLGFTMARFAPGAALAALGSRTAHLTGFGVELSF